MYIMFGFGFFSIKKLNIDQEYTFNPSIWESDTSRSLWILSQPAQHSPAKTQSQNRKQLNLNKTTLWNRLVFWAFTCLPGKLFIPHCVALFAFIMASSVLEIIFLIGASIIFPFLLITPSPRAWSSPPWGQRRNGQSQNSEARGRRLKKKTSMTLSIKNMCQMLTLTQGRDIIQWTFLWNKLELLLKAESGSFILARPPVLVCFFSHQAWYKVGLGRRCQQIPKILEDS